MIKLSIVIVILGLSIIHDCFSCTCVDTMNIEQAFISSDNVFIGTVIFIRNFDIPLDSIYLKGLNIHLAEYTFLVKYTFKGEYIKDTVNITTGIGRGDCGKIFLVDSTYIVYATYKEKYFEKGNLVTKYLYTDICSRTKKYDSCEVSKLIYYKTK
jgi:hypothetical protein